MFCEVLGLEAVVHTRTSTRGAGTLGHVIPSWRRVTASGQRRAWTALESLLGHSFRIGNATELLLQGFDPSIIAIKGRWKTRSSFLRYWRCIQEILPTFLNKDDTSTLLRLQSSFEAYSNTKL